MRHTLSLLLLGSLAVPAHAGRRKAPAMEETAPVLLGEALAAQPNTWLRMQELCDGIGHRLSGTPMLQSAEDWAAQHMTADGLSNVRKEPVQVPNWIRGEESLTLLGDHPRELPMLGLGRSIGTKGIDADVVVVGSFEELSSMDDARVKGKIVLFDVPFDGYGKTVGYRVHGPSKAAAKGAVATLVRSIGPNSLATPHTGTLHYGKDVPKIPAAAIDIESATQLHRMADRGITPRVRLVMGATEEGTVTSHNVIAEVVGREKPDEIVVVGCHLDSWDVGQGAQDDAAGCVAAMEAGRLIQQLPVAPRRTVRVVLFTNEESGLMGAKTYAKQHKDDKHVAALEMDTGAGPFLGYRVHAHGSDPEAQAALTEQMTEKLKPIHHLFAGLGHVEWTPSWSGSDVTPIVRQGALGFGLHMDTSGYWPIHHTDADTLDKIDPPTFQRDVAGMTLLTWALAEWDELPRVPEATP